MTKIRSAYSASMPMPLSAHGELASRRRRRAAAIAHRAAARRRGTSRVADQVLEQRRQQRPVALHRRAASPATIARRPPRARSPGCAAPASSDLVEVDGSTAASTRPTREKASRSLMSSCMRLAPSTAKAMYWSARSSSWPAVAPLQQLAEARHLAQRLLQVVRGDVGELLELGVGALQLLGLLVERCWSASLQRGRARRRSARASSRRRGQRAISLGPAALDPWSTSPSATARHLRRRAVQRPDDDRREQQHRTTPTAQQRRARRRRSTTRAAWSRGASSSARGSARDRGQPRAGGRAVAHRVERGACPRSSAASRLRSPAARRPIAGSA